MNQEPEQTQTPQPEAQQAAPVKSRDLIAGGVVIIDGVPFRVRKTTRKDVILRKIDPRLLKRSN